MGATIRTALTPESQRLIERHAERPQQVRRLMSQGLLQGLQETEAHIQSAYFTGFSKKSAATSRSQRLSMIRNRSGALRQAMHHDMDGELAGFVGTRRGPTSRYAQTILGGDTTRITPKNANHLWIPIADNLTAGGQSRMSPRDAMSRRTATGKRALRIFRSKAGNLVAFLPEGRAASSTADRSAVHATTGRRFQRGRRRGQQRGDLLFVLKKSVTIEGTDALAKGVEDQSDRIRELIERGLLAGMGEDA